MPQQQVSAYLVRIELFLIGVAHHWLARFFAGRHAPLQFNAGKLDGSVSLQQIHHFGIGRKIVRGRGGERSHLARLIPLE